VTSIDRSFDNCKGLKDVTVGWSIPLPIDEDVFSGVNTAKVTLHVPAGTETLYREAAVWKNFGTITPYVPSAISAPQAANAVRIYFDPATESFRIEGLTAPAQVTVINAAGQILLRQTVREGENIPAAYLPSGVYLVNVNGQIIKIIK
jgi:hypothetical protein